MNQEKLDEDRSLIPSTNQQVSEPVKKVSDVVAFSICSLGYLKLNTLYPEPYHEAFKERYVQNMVSYFKLPQRVSSTILEFVPEDEFTFLLSIKQNQQGGLFKLIEELVLISINSGCYDARAHYFIIELAKMLGIPRDLVELHCESIYSVLLTKLKQLESSTKDTTDKEQADKKKRETKDKIKKYVMIGLGSIAGGAVIGVTGGLAAPIVASALAGVVGTSLAISSAAAGVVGSIFGVAGAGLTASKMNKRIGDLEEFSFLSLNPQHDQTSLCVTIAISGWISDESPRKFARPWQNLRHSKEQYCLCYESKYLLELSQAMDYLLSFFFSFAAQEALKYTFLSSVIAAIAWPAALMSVANIIDNPWDVCIGRSEKAGRHLAEVLKSRQQGNRPVSLIGFSLGARVIFYCLQELAKQPETEGIVGDVVLLGAPVTASEDQWKPLGRVVSGSIINGYSSSDWMLKFLYRTSKVAIKVAGLQAIQWDFERLQNVDLTHLVNGHLDYCKKIDEILNFVNIKTSPNATLDIMMGANMSLGVDTINPLLSHSIKPKGVKELELGDDVSTTMKTTTMARKASMDMMTTDDAQKQKQKLAALIGDDLATKIVVAKRRGSLPDLRHKSGSVGGISNGNSNNGDNINLPASNKIIISVRRKTRRRSSWSSAARIA